jgi:hypothetical protein
MYVPTLSNYEEIAIDTAKHSDGLERGLVHEPRTL